jgi:ribosomal protein S18 acetylase RimI-like enzyme
MKIREMILTDLDSVITIYSQIYNSAYISHTELAEGKAITPNITSEQATIIFREEIAGLLKKSPSGLFVACLEDEIVGFVVASLSTTESGHIECWFDDLGVSYNYRHQGIGEQLVKKVLDWGTQNQAKYFLLESGVNNEGAHRLFKRLGFHNLSMVFWKNAST